MSSPLIPCTVQVLTKNSEKTIRHALETLMPFAEVIVQDGHSTDHTREIAKEFPNVVIMDQNSAYLDHEGRIRDFSAIRNESIRAAKYEWVLVVDADEGIRPDLTEEVRSIVAADKPGVYVAFRRFFVNGKKIDHSIVYPALQIRLFHRSLIEGYVKPVHERIKLKPDVTTQMLQSELPVPLPPARDLEAKYHRYLMMEVKRAQNLGFGGWCKWILWRNTRTIIGLSVRLLWIWIIPRKGNRLPLSYEWQFIRHSFLTIVHTFPFLTVMREKNAI